MRQGQWQEDQFTKSWGSPREAARRGSILTTNTQAEVLSLTLSMRCRPWHSVDRVFVAWNADDVDGRYAIQWRASAAEAGWWLSISGRGARRPPGDLSGAGRGERNERMRARPTDGAAQSTTMMGFQKTSVSRASGGRNDTIAAALRMCCGDGGKEFLSPPLVADPGSGLRPGLSSVSLTRSPAAPPAH